MARSDWEQIRKQANRIQAEIDALYGRYEKLVASLSAEREPTETQRSDATQLIRDIENHLHSRASRKADGGPSETMLALAQDYLREVVAGEFIPVSERTAELRVMYDRYAQVMARSGNKKLSPHLRSAARSLVTAIEWHQWYLTSRDAQDSPEYQWTEEAKEHMAQILAGELAQSRLFQFISKIVQAISRNRP